MAQTESLTRGLSELPLIEAPHPVGTISAAALRSLADTLIDSIIRALTGSEGTTVPCRDGEDGARADGAGLLQAPSEPSLMFQYFISHGWTDGLPVLPPTPSAVDDMMRAGALDKDQIIGIIPPLNGIATAEKISANAVMAGCLPEYLPLVIAAMKGMLQGGYNLDGVQTTTGNVAPLVIVNGPCRDTLQVNSGANVLGQGWRANATIGRAIRFILTNIGGAVPGLYDKATLGQPAKYTFCIGENEEASPWEPLHAERGLSRASNAVSVFGSSGVNSAVDMASQNAKGLLKTFALTMTGALASGVTSSECLFVICPEHAAIFAGGGYTKAALRQELFALARVPFEKISDENLELLSKRRPVWFQPGSSREIGVVDRPEDIWFVVAGGTGAKSAYIPGRTGTHLQTTAVDDGAGAECRC